MSNVWQPVLRVKRKLVSLLKQPFYRRRQLEYLSSLPKNADNITVMLVPGTDLISGGILSVFSFYYATQKAHGAQAHVLM
ncbi:MAG TPA: hypothetical protein VF598_01370, partial [Hymenobacter sp.]